MTHRNHYVARFYLERFTKKGKVSVYKTLVPRSSVPRWKSYSPNALAYHEHLYTGVRTGAESDEMERWLTQEIDDPASRVIEKAVAGCSMTLEDWKVLIRFTAAQDLRTPAAFGRFLEIAKKLMPEVLDQSIEDLRKELQNTQCASSGSPFQENASRLQLDYLPLRLDVLTLAALLISE